MNKKLTKLLNIILYTIFTLSLFGIFISIASNILLSSGIYLRALETNNVYERIYIEVLGDPGAEEFVSNQLQNTDIQKHSDRLFSISTSTLYLLLPPDELENITTRVLNNVFNLINDKESIDNIELNILENIDWAFSEENTENLISINEILNYYINILINLINDLREVVFFLTKILLPISIIGYLLSTFTLLFLNKKVKNNVFKILGSILIIVSFIGFMISLLLYSIFIQIDIFYFTPMSNIVNDVVISIFSELMVVLSFVLLIYSLVGLLLFFAVKNQNFTLKKLLKYFIYVIGIIGVIIIVIYLANFVKKVSSPMQCNGHQNLCERPVNEVVFPTTHNSMSIAEYMWLWPSHDGTITDQLEYGIRGFLIDTHYYDAVSSISSYFPDATEEELIQLDSFLDNVGVEKKDGTYLCHMVCNIGNTSFSESLGEVKLFLDENPNEVLVFIIEDKISPEDTEIAFKESGLIEFVYMNEDGNRWPTLKEMIDSNERVIVMAEVEGDPSGPQWYKNAWEYTEETPYAFHDVSELQDENSCIPNRGDTNKDFFLMNHWIERVSPSRVDSSIVNDYEFLMNRINNCEEIREKLPNFVAVNFYQNGDLIEVVNELNSKNN